MKLCNKKTGEIVPLSIYGIQVNSRTEEQPLYHSIAELTDDWEDYEEPKEYCYITSRGNFHFIEDIDDEGDKDRKQIGNYFQTKEEAEKAVEKLKAWERLKEAGAEFYGWRRNQTGTYELYMRWEDRIPRSYEVKNDLNLLFGGEEC